MHFLIQTRKMYLGRFLNLNLVSDALKQRMKQELNGGLRNVFGFIGKIYEAAVVLNPNKEELDEKKINEIIEAAFDGKKKML